MKKIELINFADFFGKRLPIGKIKDSETRREIVLLAASLTKAAKEIDSEVEAVRSRLVEGYEEDVKQYSNLLLKAQAAETSEAERKSLIEQANAITEAVRINNEFREAASSIYSEDAPEVPIRKVDLTVLIDAFVDCDAIKEQGVTAIQNEFKEIIK